MEAKEMKRAWMVGTAVVVAAMAAQAGPRKPQTDALVTVVTYDRADVPWVVRVRAEQVATAAFAAAGIEVKWLVGKQLGKRREVTSGEVLTVVFDGLAPAQASPEAMAFTNVGGAADADVHVFYSRVAGFGGFRNRLYAPELLGNVLAHELTHALEGVARHSSEGLMKAAWSTDDYAKMARRCPLAFAAEDLELLRAHFSKETSPAPTLVAAR
jgi:hypothetical protein